MTDDGWVSANEVVDRAREVETDELDRIGVSGVRKDPRPKCEICGFPATTERGLAAHVKAKHGNGSQAPAVPQSLGSLGLPLECGEEGCTHVSKAPQGAASHARWHAAMEGRISVTKTADAVVEVVELPSGVLLEGTKEIGRLPRTGDFGRLFWRDAYSTTDRERPPFRCEVETVGWVLEGDAEYAEIASERIERAEEVEYRGMTYVPRVIVERFEPI
jgi:hypothetical protein